MGGGPGKRGPSTGYFENSLNESSGYGPSLSTGDLLRETGGETPFLGLLKVMKGRLSRRTSVSMEARLGNLEWAHIPGTLRYG